MAAPLVAGLGLAAYGAALRDYGIADFGDEGLQLAQAWRVSHGQLPYVDFHTGYGPLYFWMQGALVSWAGLEAVRWMLVGLHAAAAMLVYLITRRLLGSALATVAVLLEVAFFLPLAPSRGVPFLIPYPAWYVSLAALAIAFLLQRTQPSAARFLVSGALAGAAFAMKVNSGLLLAAAAASVAVLAGERREAGPAGKAVLGLVGLGSVLLVAETGLTISAWVLAPPVLGLAWLGRGRGAPDGYTGPRLAALAAGFLPVAAFCYAPSFVRLGPQRFGRQALLLGAGFAGTYAVAYPWPAALGAAVGLAAFALADRTPRSVLAAGAAATLALAVLTGARSAPSLAAAPRLAAEVSTLALVPLAVWAAIGALRRRVDPALLGPAAVAALAALQLYPRPDFEHLAQVAPVLLPLGLRAWRRCVEMLSPAPAVVVAVPLLLAAARFAPTAVTLGRLATGAREEVRVASTRLLIAPEGAERLRALAAAVDAVQRNTAPPDLVLTFPACAIVPFFAERLPAGPHDYFFPGRPDRAEVAALSQHLAAAPPPVAVTCSAPGSDLARAWDAYPELVRFITTRYHVLLDRPPFVVRRVAQ